MSYTLNPQGVVAVYKWLSENRIDWDLHATVNELDEVLINRKPGESLEIEIRGPNWTGGNAGLVFFTPAPDEVDELERLE